MADISMCAGKGCKRKDKCYRHTAKANEHWQSYIAPEPEGCEHFWDNEDYKPKRLTKAKPSTKSPPKKTKEDSHEKVRSSPGSPRKPRLRR